MEKKHHFFDKARNVRRVLKLFFFVCALFFLGDFFIHKSHAHFEVEKSFGFFAVYGFVSFIVLVAVAKYILRPLVMRREDYYE